MTENATGAGQEPNEQTQQQNEQNQGQNEGQQQTQQSQQNEQDRGQQQSQGEGQARSLESMTPDQMQAEIQRLRRENGSYRTDRNAERDRSQEIVSAVSQALGVTQESAQDPQEVQRQLDARNQDYNRERARNQVYQAAMAQNADPSLAWALLYSENTLANANPDGEGFSDLVNAEVANLAQSNPRVRMDYSPQAQNAGGGGSNPPADESQTEENPWSEKHFNMTEQGRLLRDEPEKARRFKAAAGYK